MRTLAAFAILLLVAACQAPPPEMSEAEIAEIEAEVTGVWEDFLQGHEELDCDKAGEALHPDLLAFPLDSRLLGQSEWLDACNHFLESVESLTGYWADANVRVLTPDLAVFTGYYGDTVYHIDGSVREWPGNCNRIALMERTEEGWKATIIAGTCGSGEPVEDG